MENDREKFKAEFRNRIYKWVLRLIDFIETLPRSPAGQVMGRQLLRSGTSVLANYVEAGSASSRKDFINFFTHSLKSADESLVWLSLLRDTKKGDAKECQWLSKEVEEIANVLASAILKLKGKR